MTWYYYSGRTPIPIPVKNGVSVSVRPGSKIEVLEETKELELLKQQHLIKRTSPDVKPFKVADIKVSELKVSDVVAPSKLAIAMSGQIIEEMVKTVIDGGINASDTNDEKKDTIIENEKEKIEETESLGEDTGVKVARKRRKSGESLGMETIKDE